MQPMAQDAMDLIARYYDLDLDGFDDDLDLYRGYARRSGGPILELGCGTGRVSRALAAEGYEVTGLDISPAMLERARKEKSNVTWAQGDLAALALDGKFGLVLAPLGTLLHIKPEDRLSTFKSIAARLQPGGLFVLDLPVESAWLPGIQPLVCQWTRLDRTTGAQVSKLVSAEADVTTLTQRVTYIFDEIEMEGTLKRATTTFDLSYYTESEAVLLIEQSGLAVEAIHGGYDFSELEADSERMIICATSPQ